MLESIGTVEKVPEFLEQVKQRKRKLMVEYKLTAHTWPIFELMRCKGLWASCVQKLRPSRQDHQEDRIRGLTVPCEISVCCNITYVRDRCLTSAARSR